MDKIALTRQETAERMGISLPNLDAFLHRKEHPLPSIQSGRKIIIPRIALDAWLLEESKRTLSHAPRPLQ